MSIKDYAADFGYDLRRAGGTYILSRNGKEVGRFKSAGEIRANLDALGEKPSDEPQEAAPEQKATKTAPKKAAPEKAQEKAVDPRKGMKYDRCSPEGCCGRVWELAEELPTRKAVIEAAVEEGIHKGTASTQYARWKAAVAEEIEAMRKVKENS